VRAIVTGAARGLGEAIAARLSSEGGDIFLVDVSDSVTETAARLGSATGGRVGCAVADVSSETAGRATLEKAISSLGGLDLLVNNAGIGGPGTPVIATAPAAFRRVLEVNLVGTFLCSQVAAAAMIRQGEGGSIVNTASLFGQQGVPGNAAYCASKAGVMLLTQSMARELAPHGIRVNAVAPGHMATSMHWEELRARAEASGTTFDEQLHAIRQEIPLGRHGTGEDVAGAVAWLASKDAAYVTGQTIGVNGGVYFS
jgi:NAD(P)-dependent dehydrogenase (short-subunit alcohol dehydrogenase family)